MWEGLIQGADRKENDGEFEIWKNAAFIKNGLDQWFYVGNLIFGATGLKANDADRCLVKKNPVMQQQGNPFILSTTLSDKKCRTKFLSGKIFCHPWKILSLLSDEKLCPTEILSNVENFNSCFFLSLFSQDGLKQKNKKQIYIILLKLVFWQNKHNIKSQSSIEIASNHFGGFFLTVGSTT